MDSQRAPAKEDVDATLSRRAEFFRSRLIEEFKLLDCLSDQGRQKAPVYSSSNLVEDPSIMEKLLMETPAQMVRFKAYKRNEAPPDVDRRSTRVKNRNQLPLGTWAKWLVENEWFQRFLMILIFVDAVSVGVQIELPNASSADIVWGKLFLNFVDTTTLVVFSAEIVLKWMDNFITFWRNGWNVFDFIITVLSAIPHIVMIGLGNRTSVVATVIRKISIFRILRSLRMISKFDGLRIIVLTALQALQSLVFITLLLLIVGYIFAIVGVIFFGSLSVASDDEAGRFQNLLDAMIILFQLFTLDQWLNIYVKLSSIAGPVLTTFYILLWIWIGSFVFRNLFVGIMVNNFQNISSSLLEQQNNMVESMELAKKKEELDLEINKQENRMCTTRKSLFDPHFLTGIPELEDSSCTPEISDDLLKQQKSHISQLILTEEKMAEGWDEMVHENLKALSTDPVQTLWPRDTLFKYYQLMEQLQENMEEYNELQQLIGTPMVPSSVC